MAARLCHTGPNRVQMAYNKKAQKEADQSAYFVVAQRAIRGR
jgi:hypothetical protein